MGVNTNVDLCTIVLTHPTLTSVPVLATNTSRKRSPTDHGRP